MTTPDTFTKSELFERALRRILRPLVRAMIAQGVTAPALYRVIKDTYVHVAAEDLQEAATDSRISIVTGVHRRDVKAFRAEDAEVDQTLARKVSTLATVIGRWLTDPDFTDASGSPKPLPRLSMTDPSFEDLAQRISRDIRPRTVLDELLRQGVVTHDLDSDVVHLDADALVGPADLDQKLHFFSHNLGDHMNAAVDNLLSDPSPFMERAVFYNSLTAESVDAIEAKAREAGSAALRQINSDAANLQNEDMNTPTANQRFRFGLFFYREDEGPEAPEDAASQSTTKDAE